MSSASASIRRPTSGLSLTRRLGSVPPLVRAAHWITRFDDVWRSPMWRHWLGGFSRHRTQICSGERGCRLSPYDTGADLVVQDLEMVVDCSELERFPLIGVCQDGPMAVESARRHPERVSHLMVVGTFVQDRLIRATTLELKVDLELRRNVIQSGWVSAAPRTASSSPPP
jgi:pimeloyl-ACP methyl ester carboxylesterase